MPSNKILATVVAIAVLTLIAVALGGCKQDVEFSLERVPEEYRSCATQVVPELAEDRRVTQADLIRYTARLKRYAHSQNACLRGLVKWADAQWRTYYRQF